jgi:modulator of FtsH protease
MFALVEAYRPDQWHDFFVMVGGSAAVLLGLVFVALSLNVDAVTRDASHRYRGIDTLSGMTGVFILCALVLMGGQDHRAVGAEWLAVAALSVGVYIHGHVQAVRLGGNLAVLRASRTVMLAVLYLVQLVGAALLVANHIAGLYMAAVALVAALAFMISGAWLLVVDATTREPNPVNRGT